MNYWPVHGKKGDDNNSWLTEKAELVYEMMELNLNRMRNSENEESGDKELKYDVKDC